MLATGPASEIVPAHHNFGVFVSGPVEHEVGFVDGHLFPQSRDLVGVFVAQFRERREPQSGALYGLEKFFGNDHVGVDVLNVEGGGDPLQGGEFGQTRGTGGAFPRLVLEIGRDGGDDGSRGHVDLRGEGPAPRGIGEASGILLLRPKVGMVADVRQRSGDGRRGGHGGAHEVGPSAVSLAAFEVSVGGGGASFQRLEFVGVHGEAHGAAGFAEVEAGVGEYFVEAFVLGLFFDEAGAGDDHGVDSGGDFAAHGESGHFADVFDAAVGAGADEDFVDGNAENGLSFLETDIFQRTSGRFLSRRIGIVAKDGNGPGYRRHVLRTGSPGDRGRNVLGIDDDRLVIHGALVAVETRPVFHGAVPLLSIGRHGPSLQILEGDLVRTDEAGAGSRLDSHVGDGHAGLHGQLADGLPRELHGASGASGGADKAAHVQNDVLGPYPSGQLSVDPNQHVLSLGLGEGLRGQHVLHLAGPDPERERPEGPVGGGVAVPAHARGSGQGEPLLRTDDVHDALSLVRHPEVLHAEVPHVLLHLQHLRARVDLVDEGAHVRQFRAVLRGNVVVHRGQGAVRTAEAAAREAEALEGLGGGHLVDQVTVDVEEGGAFFGHLHRVVVEDFVVQGAGGGRGRGRGHAEEAADGTKLRTGTEGEGGQATDGRHETEDARGGRQQDAEAI
mmetsp:Transcript_5266/g.10699  ORF Transcript_5266/g.10699 Transcript_5266/m.10699 type:complete len:671 (-) Transcript_5266:225-2237(-)